MWNSEAPLTLLNGMSEHLNAANLERIQQMIDVDKYCNSFDLSKDLCGEYAPFCKFCDKSVDCPCAVAYVKMMQAENFNVEIAAADSGEVSSAEEQTVEKTVEENTEKKPSLGRVRIAVAKRRK